MSAAVFEKKLAQIEAIFKNTLDTESFRTVLEIIGAPAMEKDVLDNVMLYNETLPKAQEFPFTTEKRLLHFLWDLFDKVPLSLIVPFSMPLRRLIAHHLFGSCGAALVAEENVRFNFAALLDFGDNVFLNRGVFIDSKGGVELGDNVALAEDVRIFTHGHSEASHLERTYAKVVVKPYAKIYSGATILPGVVIGEEAIVGSGAMVTKDVPPNMVVAGIPAKPVRERRSEGRHGDALDHVWLF